MAIEMIKSFGFLRGQVYTSWMKPESKVESVYVNDTPERLLFKNPLTTTLSIGLEASINLQHTVQDVHSGDSPIKKFITWTTPSRM